MPCDMTGGANDGPWPTGFDAANGHGVLVSVNSHGDGLSDSTHMHGPVFGDVAIARLRADAAVLLRFLDDHGTP